MAARPGALARGPRRRRSRRPSCRRRPPCRSRTAAAPRPRRPPRPPGSDVSQAPIRSPTRGWIWPSSHFSSSVSAKTIEPIRSRSTFPPGATFLPPALDQPRQQRLGLEQLVDHRVAGDRLRPQPLKGGKRLGLPSRDPPSKPDRKRPGHSPAQDSGGASSTRQPETPQPQAPALQPQPQALCLLGSRLLSLRLLSHLIGRSGRLLGNRLLSLPQPRPRQQAPPLGDGSAAPPQASLRGWRGGGASGG